MQITTDAEYAAAIDRVQKLTGAPEDTPEETDLLATDDAIEAWKH